MSAYWFAAAPSAQELSRVSLDFGLRRADRTLRELIVPEMGRIWFGRQLSWPVAALALRDALRGIVTVKASTISHALEALGCKLEWAKNEEGTRILGKRAFGRDGDDVWRFKELREAGLLLRAQDAGLAGSDSTENAVAAAREGAAEQRTPGGSAEA
jgi:hypothetical protein